MSAARITLKGKQLAGFNAAVKAGDPRSHAELQKAARTCPHCGSHREWYDPKEIVDYPELHSSAMEIKPLLIVMPHLTKPCLGWYFGGLINQWRQEGSPSEQKPTHWRPMPDMPKPK